MICQVSFISLYFPYVRTKGWFLLSYQIAEDERQIRTYRDGTQKIKEEIEALQTKAKIFQVCFVVVVVSPGAYWCVESERPN